MSVLKIKNSDNQWVEIPTINGKSAYAYAVDGGYTGTEAQFALKLAQENVASVNGRTGAVTGLIDAPSSPATGAFLVWNGSAWVAQVLTDADSTSYGGAS